ncbi:DUF4176 domain-containing protein [Streptococcus sp. H49]|uniref:DUF4176 domain-containing protein n=1 Tax=Streptococcus huangxiaojuni TaxID=3237239 RepID=UPI0034A58A60
MIPVGSVVYLKEGNQKIVILNRGPLVNQKGKTVLFDYTGALFPQGLDDEVYYFNHEDIDEVLFTGLVDDDELRLEKLYRDWLKREGRKYPKGITE